MARGRGERGARAVARGRSSTAADQKVAPRRLSSKSSSLGKTARPNDGHDPCTGRVTIAQIGSKKLNKKQLKNAKSKLKF